MKSIAPLVVIVGVFASTACGQSLRVATYNLNWGNGAGDEVLAAITESKADVVCLQETTPQSEAFLRKHLQATYPHFHSAGHEGRYAAERFTFASKIKLEDVTYVPPKTGLFGFQSARLQHEGNTVHIVNVHLSPILVARGGGLRGAMAALSAAEEKHAAEIGEIVETIDCTNPTIVVGDFNSPSGFRAPQRLKDLGMVDAYASVHDDADTHATWHWPTRPVPLALRIDYVFCTPHFAATQAQIIRRKGSDHSLVVVELKTQQPIPPPESPALAK